MAAGYKWIHWTTKWRGDPPNAVYAGEDLDGSPIFVGRAYHDDDLLPGKVIPRRNKTFVPYGGKEISKDYFEVLTGTGFSWVASSDGNVPIRALIAGRTSYGEPLYVGRTHYKGSLTPGKVHPSEGCLFIPFGHTERAIETYEVLVADPTDEEKNQTCNGNPSLSKANLASPNLSGLSIRNGRENIHRNQIPVEVIPNTKITYTRSQVKESSSSRFNAGLNLQPMLGFGDFGANISFGHENNRTTTNNLETLLVQNGVIPGQLGRSN